MLYIFPGENHKTEKNISSMTILAQGFSSVTSDIKFICTEIKVMV